MSIMIRVTIENIEPWPHENNAARTKDTKIYEQTVDSLDIPAVIAVINGLEKRKVIVSAPVCKHAWSAWTVELGGGIQRSHICELCGEKEVE